MKAPQTIETLRNHLFSTLAAIQDKQHPMDIERARLVADVAQVIINSAKVEVDHLRVTGGDGSGFIPSSQKNSAPDPAALPDGTTSPRPGVLIHRMKG